MCSMGSGLLLLRIKFAFFILWSLCDVFVQSDHGPAHNRRSLPTNRTIVDCRKFGLEKNEYKCILSKETTEGPFFIPDDLKRKDVRDGEQGLPFRLCTKIINQHTCRPISKALVHIWLANAYGQYSGYENITGPPFPNNPISETRYLRGFQVTGSGGRVCFKLIYPGWYIIRTTHIHVEVYTKGKVVYIGQLFIDDRISDFVYNNYSPYNYRDNTQRLKNADDKYFNATDGANLLKIKPTLRGYFSEIKLAIDPQHDSNQKWPKN